MAVRGNHPRTGGDGGGYWCWLKVPAGTKGLGWIAGDIHAYPAHLGKPSLVCEQTLGVPGVKCPKCKVGVPVRLMGYLPVYRDDGKPCVLVLHEHTFEAVGELPHLCAVQWLRRTAEENEPVTVTRATEPGRFVSALPEREKKQDIAIAMCRYWRRADLVPHLVKWLSCAAEVAAAVDVPEVPPELAKRATAKNAPGKSRHRETLAEASGLNVPPLLDPSTALMLAKNRALAREAAESKRSG